MRILRFGGWWMGRFVVSFVGDGFEMGRADAGGGVGF